MSSPLISIEELASCYCDADVRVFDCRFALADTLEGERLYARDHIPGALYLHLDRDLSGAKGQHGGRHPLPDAADLQQRLRQAGVNSAPATKVVVYDDSRMAFAARAWWLLRYLGHDRVQVLDGGLKAWRAAGLPLSDTVIRPAQGNFLAVPRLEQVVDINTVKTIPHTVGAVLIDSRERDRYLGKSEPIDPVAGHIAGAVNYPWQDVTDANGIFQHESAQRQRWGEQLQAEELVVYCGSGVTACVNLLSLSALGRDDARLYAGSWSDWCSYLAQDQAAAE